MLPLRKALKAFYEEKLGKNFRKKILKTFSDEKLYTAF